MGFYSSLDRNFNASAEQEEAINFMYCITVHQNLLHRLTLSVNIFISSYNAPSSDSQLKSAVAVKAVMHCVG